MRFIAAALALAACSSGPPPEAIAPIVGNLIVGAPWPVPIKDPLAIVKVYTTLDGKPIPVMVMIACGGAIGGLGVERVFVHTGATSHFAPDAVEVANPVDHAMRLTTRWLQEFERQGFEMQGQFGGSVEAIQAMTKAIVDKKARGEEVGSKEFQSSGIDRSQLERGNGYFLVIMKRGEVTRTISVGNIMGTAKVMVSEDLACPTGSRMPDLNAPEVVLPIR